MNRYEIMLSYVPLYYHTSGIFKAILDVEGLEFDSLRQNIEDVKNQFFIRTATWGLELWEKEFALAPNPALGEEDRRSRIMGKLRGIGTVGTGLIKSVSEAYSNGEVRVDFDGSITITFIGTRGIPQGLNELKVQLNEIIPAHIPIEFAFTYLSWKEFDLLPAAVQESMTWAQLEVYRPV